MVQATVLIRTQSVSKQPCFPVTHCFPLLVRPHVVHVMCVLKSLVLRDYWVKGMQCVPMSFVPERECVSVCLYVSVCGLFVSLVIFVCVYGLSSGG